MCKPSCAQVNSDIEAHASPQHIQFPNRQHNLEHCISLPWGHDLILRLPRHKSILCNINNRKIYSCIGIWNFEIVMQVKKCAPCYIRTYHRPFQSTLPCDIYFFLISGRNYSWLILNGPSMSGWNLCRLNIFMDLSCKNN